MNNNNYTKHYFLLGLLFVLSLAFSNLNAQTASNRSGGASPTLRIDGQDYQGYCVEYTEGIAPSGHSYNFDLTPDDITNDKITACLNGRSTYGVSATQSCIWYFSDGITPSSTSSVWQIINRVNNGTYQPVCASEWTPTNWQSYQDIMTSGDPYTQCSPNTNCEVAFTNDACDVVKLYWNDNGTHRYYADINTGSTYTQNTYAGHNWIFKYEDNSQVGTYTVSCGDTYRITDNCDPCQNATINLTCEKNVNNTGWSILSGCEIQVCAGDNLMLSVNPNVSTVNWTGPNGFSRTGQNDILISNSVTANQSGTYTATLTDGNGCVGTTNIQVTIYRNPKANNDTYQACSGEEAIVNVIDNDTNLNNPTVVITGGNFNGVATVTPSNQIRLSPIAGICGRSTITYQLCNGIKDSGCCDEAELEIIYAPSTDPTFSSNPNDVSVQCEDDIPNVPNITATDGCGDVASVDFSEIIYEGSVTACANRTLSPIVRCGDNTAKDGTIALVGYNRDYVISNGQLTEYTDGTARITGRLTNVTDTNLGFDIDVRLFGKTYNTPNGSPKLEAECAYPDVNTFYYYVGMNGTLRGRGDFAGTVLDVHRFGPAAQIGQGASSFNTGFGLAVWFRVEIASQPNSGITLELEPVGNGVNGQEGDFNFMLSGDGNVCEQPTPDCSNYKIVRTWVANDCNYFNTSTITQTITVNDTEKPVISGMPTDATVSCSNIPTAPTLTATDNCDGTVNVQFNETDTQGNDSANCNYYNYTITRTWTATDACGNQQIATQTITVSDNTDPVLTSIPADVTVECDNIPTAPTNISATDDCTDTANISIDYSETDTQSNDPNSCDYYNYTITRTWTATDACGNQDTDSQVITVRDTKAPEVCCRDITIQLDANGTSIYHATGSRLWCNR